MAFTYDVSTDRGQVRLLVGDTDSTDALLQDDEIDFFLDQANNNVYYAGSYAANAIAGKFARKADVTVESVSKKYSQQSQGYYRLAKNLLSQASSANIVSPAITGISEDAIRQQRQDEDRVQSEFYMDRFNNPQNDEDDDYLCQ